jgi:hypothetical protein
MAMEAEKINPEELVSLGEFSQVIGFPLELIKTELLLDENLNQESTISMNILRQAMLKYLDVSMS